MLNHKKLLDNTRTLLKIPSDTPFGENKEDKFKACLEAINFCQAEIESLGAVSEVLVYEGGHHKWDYAVPNLYTEINHQLLKLV